MQYNITTSLIVSLSENGFGLDELIYRMEELANKKAFPQLLKTIVLLVDENLRLKVMLRQPLPEKCGCTCAHPDLVLDGGMPRKIRTRLGIVDLQRITRVKCKHCGKTFVPLALMCGLERHQTMSNELAKLVLEQCAQESYRVATGNIHEMTAAKESHSTFRRWVLKTDADEIRVPEGTMGAVPGVLYADGTKCKSIGADGRACKGDVKVLLEGCSDIAQDRRKIARLDAAGCTPDSVALPVFFDWEDISHDEARTDGLDGETITACAIAFCERVAAAGFTPGLYAYRYLAYFNYDLPRLTNYALWVGALGAESDFYYAHEFWQNAVTDGISGINGEVDRNFRFVKLPEPVQTDEAEA